MSRFYVGQRVRIVSTVNSTMAIHVGKEGVIVSPCSVHKGLWDVSGAQVTSDGFACSWFESSLAPILYDGNQLVSWEECLWQPSGVEA